MALLVIGVSGEDTSRERSLSLLVTHGLDDRTIGDLEVGLLDMGSGLRRRGEAILVPGSLAAWCALVCHAGAYRALELGKEQDYRGLLFLASREDVDPPRADEELLAFVAQSMETAIDGAVGMAVIAAREKEIKALHEIGKEISALTSLDRVLLLICRKAAELLGVEISYVALADKAQTEIRMCMTFGISESWRYRMWMPFGQGVGGAVAQSRRPLIIEDYGSFDHPTRDEIRYMVLQERIRAVLAVPMLVGDLVTGVLYVADRRPALFTAHDARLLQGLADQAAIAITNSELYEQKHREVQVHDRLMEIALRNGGYQQLAEDLQLLVGNPVALYDKNLNLLACHPSAEGGGVLSDCHLKEALAAVDEEQAASALSLLTGRRQGFLTGPMPEVSLPNGRVVAPALSGNDFLGYVHFLEEERKLNDYDVRVAERAAVILALRVMRERAEAEVEQRLRGELLDDLLASDVETVDGAVKRSAHLGHELDGAHLVLAVELDAALASGQGDVMTLRERLLEQVKLGLDASGADAVTDVKEERVVSLVKCPDEDRQTHGPNVVGRLLRDRLERKFFQAPLFVGLGGVCQEPHEFRRSYEEALVCLRVARSQPGTTLVAYEDLDLISLLFASDHTERLTNFVEARLGALVRYDSEHRSELVKTVSRYLDLSCNKAAAAAALNVHLSTLKYRLERIQTILELDLSDPESRFTMHLAVRALDASRLLRRPRCL